MFRSILSAQFNLDTRLDLHRAVTDSEWTIRHLSVFKSLTVHAGCVNTIQWNKSGDLILSGSDDRKLVVTRWADSQVVKQVKSLHKNNIMSAKFLPQTADRQAVSCSGDGVIIVSDLEAENGSSQDIFKCHHGPVYEVVTVESEPNIFLSVGEDGTARWFDLRATKNCQVSRCKENVLFVCQSPLSSAAINPVLPHEFVIGTADSHVYVMDRRKLSAGCLFSPIQSIVASMKVPSLTNNSCRTTSVQFSPEGDQVLASFSGEGVYLFDVKDPTLNLPLSIPKNELEEQFSGSVDSPSSLRRTRQCHNFKRVRLRGDWSDTGPSAGVSGITPDIGQARPTVHESFMQRMAEVLRSMSNLNSSNVATLSNSFENPSEEPSFPIANEVITSSAPVIRGEGNSREEIDYVTYESLGRSENQSENQLENMQGDHIEDSPSNYLDDRSEAFPHFRNRQNSEQSLNGFPLLSDSSGCGDSGCVDEEMGSDYLPPNSDMVYQPIPKMKYIGHRNSRTAINEASFWGRSHIMSGSDCGHVFIWNRHTGKVVSVLQADTRVVNRVRSHPYEPILATSGIDYDIKLWTPLAHTENDINVEELMARNARMLEETRDTITIPASYMIRMLASMTRFWQSNNRTNLE